jgi:hypothetical protein
MYGPIIFEKSSLCYTEESIKVNKFTETATENALQPTR